MPVGRQRHGDDARPDLRARLGRESERRDPARAIALHEHVASRSKEDSRSHSSSARKSSAAESLPRPVSVSSSGKPGRCGAVMRMTSAPCAASVRPHTGPAMTRVRSSTRMPDSGRSAREAARGAGASPPLGSPAGGAAPPRSLADARPIRRASASSVATSLASAGRRLGNFSPSHLASGGLHSAKLVATMMRSPSEWGARPQGSAVAQLPLLGVRRIGEAPARALPPGGMAAVGHPRAGSDARHRRPRVRRTLAAHGADVMRITRRTSRFPAAGHRHRPRQALGRARLARRGGARAAAGLAARGARVRAGLSPGGIARRVLARSLRGDAPGIVAVSLSAYRQRPVGSRRGFDSLVQNACGINHAEAEAGRATGPRSCPRRR